MEGCNDTQIYTGTETGVGTWRDTGTETGVGTWRDVGTWRGVGTWRDVGVWRDVGPWRDVGTWRDVGEHIQTYEKVQGTYSCTNGIDCPRRSPMNTLCLPHRLFC